MKVAVFGCGYWAAFQVAVWQDLGVKVVAVWNRTSAKAHEFALKFNIPKVFDTPEELFEWGEFDVADIIADVGAHEELVLMSAAYRKNVICQKPMSDTLESCVNMVEACKNAGVLFAVHENFRYQPPTVMFKQALDSGVAGKILNARIVMRSPDEAIMSKQPALTVMPHMVLRDMGPHIFDVARYFFGEAQSIYALPVYSYPQYKVPDAALCTFKMANNVALHCDLLHKWNDRFVAEGENGVIRLDYFNILHIECGDDKRQIDTKTWSVLDYIPKFDWDLHGGHIFSSIPACLNDLINAFENNVPAPTCGEDNLKTMRLVFAAIESFDTGNVVKVEDN